ncbi:glycoside hydrolase family 79 protein [Tulasnella calospora MUT 4182]|uniref:Glycoside hydrolase family 79 protein n=1 Tax=Tulasnella calospora MUT 4182 TaxID=1051891 RepID=A0A0C3Q7U4_9AGAM|nr:glycoside hydrolase family 79 protein [Tulasnella calospora MUT 4182]
MAVYQMDERPLKIPMEYNGVSYENVWRVAEACWPKSPADRISMSEAFQLLRADPSLT